MEDIKRGAGGRKTMRRVGGKKEWEREKVRWMRETGGGCERVQDGRWIERGNEESVQME